MLLILPGAASAADTTAVGDDTFGAGSYTSLALDAAGNPIVAYYEQLAGDLRVLHCGDPSCAGTNSIEIPDSDGLVGTYTSIVLDSAGNPTIAYHRGTSGDLRVLSCGDTDCATGSVVDAVTANVVGSFTSMALNSAGSPIISYYDSTSDKLRVLRCGNPTCGVVSSIEAPDPAGNTNDLGSDTSLVLDANDYPVISYYDRSNDDLKLARCHNESCSTTATIVTLDSAGNVGADTSLVLGAGERPIIAYYDSTNKDLKVLHCGDALCSAGNSITSPDSVGDVGIDPTLVLGAGGNPIVSYYGDSDSDGDGDLKILNCGNPSCTVGNVITTADAVDDVGVHTSMVLDAAGNPVVAYQDRTNLELRVLHCDDPFCAPATFCNGLEVTIDMNVNGGNGIGTAGDDVILGSPGADSINGKAGDDVICGGAGADTIKGGPGSDTIFGEGGSDELSGGGGSDDLDGGAGNDTIKGQGGGDTVNGGAGDDVIDGQGALDTIFGDGGNDEINGQNGGDVIDGGAGDDRIGGQVGPDTIRGGSDDDVLLGGDGGDTLYGGSGVDRCSGNTGPDSAEGSTCEQTPGIEVIF